MVDRVKFIEENALNKVERIIGVGYVIAAANGQELFITDEILDMLAAERMAEKATA